MPRRLKGECKKCGKIDEYIVGIHEPLRCSGCKSKKVETVWDEKGTMGAPGFRVKGMSKNFR